MLLAERVSGGGVGRCTNDDLVASPPAPRIGSSAAGRSTAPPNGVERCSSRRWRPVGRPAPHARDEHRPWGDGRRTCRRCYATRRVPGSGSGRRAVPHAPRTGALPTPEEVAARIIEEHLAAPSLTAGRGRQCPAVASRGCQGTRQVVQGVWRREIYEVVMETKGFTEEQQAVLTKDGRMPQIQYPSTGHGPTSRESAPSVRLVARGVWAITEKGESLTPQRYCHRQS